MTLRRKCNGAKHITETTGSFVLRNEWAVGERSAVVRSVTVRRRGRSRSENVGTSSDKTGEKPVRRKPEVSWARLILPGSVGPKPRPRGVGEGKRVNIPYL